LSKNIGVPPEHVLYEMSYENATLYGYSAPYYDHDKDKEKDWDESIDANNPNNFTNNEEEIFIR